MKPPWTLPVPTHPLKPFILWGWLLVVQWLKSCSTFDHPVDCSTQASLSFTISPGLLKLLSLGLVIANGMVHSFS